MAGSIPAFAYATSFNHALFTETNVGAAQIPIPKGMRQAMSSEHASYWLDAIYKEYSSILAHDVFTVQQWQRHDVAPIQIDLLKRRLDYLGQLLADNGITLHIIDGGDYYGCVQQLTAFCQQHTVSSIYANKEYEINEVERDQAFLKDADEVGISLRLFDGDVIAPPGTVLNQSGEMFKVFTPI